MSLAPPGADSSSAGAAAVLISKTCQNCFSLKIRCDRTQRQDICDRCARLGKPCIFRPARRRDNSAKRDSRIQALEQQVKDLLRLQQKGPIVQQPLPEGSATAARQSSPPVAGEGDIIDDDVVSIERAETLVAMYKTDMMPHFPFVIIPPHTTAGDIRHAKPFLFLAIISVACYHDLQTQDKLYHRFKYLVSDKVLYGGDECLDLQYLQGLLIALAWNQFHGRSKNYSQYLQLAISIAVDLRLDRKPIHQKPNEGSKRDPIARDQYKGEANSDSAAQRAAAGIFYIASTIAKLLDKMNTFACTPFIEEGCLLLQQKAEYRTDKDLYHVVRLQQILENIDQIAKVAHHSEADAHSSYLRVRAELEAFRVYLCSDVSDSHLLFMQFHTAKLFLYQVAFFERNLQQSPYLHLNILCEGLEGAKSFLDLYLWLPPKSEMALTNIEWIQLSFGVTLAAKFAIVSRNPHVEAQTRELRHRLNIDHVFRHLALRIGALVGRAGDGNKQRDIFYYYEQRTRKIQNWYEKMIRATGTASPPQAAYQQRSSSQSQSQPSPPPSTTSSEVPVSTTFSHQQPQGYTASINYPDYSLPQNSGQPPVQPPMHPQPMVDVGMAPLSSYQQYSPTPAIAFPDLMMAQGWDNMFAIPMEHDATFDTSQGYGLGMASPPSDGSSWAESPASQ
ncbi:uncharacterized protein M421DRAFT_420747 [Didymella exigua CBS 183.55]|uniref:Zn(2)-C6 fungal-type domain-containing protein n=1 Tax=Didymella exigua CBS 183.55 TaxID=1150837 RepID=A0A6A5RRU2_9PLEO|nr:uncharacterized protein M421DRAFT_420747 [Didymella exigua CBS 183.55]KAF1928207.1 hypothetical protein M421DRAFT_420747 [Didymella exigua CBS 183.55]